MSIASIRVRVEHSVAKMYSQGSPRSSRLIIFVNGILCIAFFLQHLIRQRVLTDLVFEGKHEYI